MYHQSGSRIRIRKQENAEKQEKRSANFSFRSDAVVVAVFQVLKIIHKNLLKNVIYEECLRPIMERDLT